MTYKTIIIKFGKKFILIAVEVLLLVIINSTMVKAESTACASGILKAFQYNEVEPDKRINQLQSYLVQHSSPLTIYASDIISKSDKYGLFDWKLIPAIAGVESTFGKHIPAGSFNAWGIANGQYYFSSWEDAVDYVASLIKTKYIDRGLDTVDKIAPIYAPPSFTWSYKVKYFMKQIAAYQQNQVEDLKLN